MNSVPNLGLPGEYLISASFPGQTPAIRVMGEMPKKNWPSSAMLMPSAENNNNPAAQRDINQYWSTNNRSPINDHGRSFRTMLPWPLRDDHRADFATLADGAHIIVSDVLDKIPAAS